MKVTLLDEDGQPYEVEGFQAWCHVVFYCYLIAAIIFFCFFA